jgi:hypothetical protein
MNMAPTETKPGRIRRGLVTALTAAVLLPILSYAAVASIATNKLRAMRSAALLSNLKSEQSASLATLPEGTVRTAIAAEPLDGRIVNVAMARDVRQHGEARSAAWLPTISQLGWRDTASLQNQLYVAANAADMSRILSISDALLRRQQMIDQVVAILAMIEADDTLRPALLDRLAGRPGWRAVYLTSTGTLQTDAQLIARYKLFRELAARGAMPSRGEIISNIAALDRGERFAHAFALWRQIRPTATRPLDDQNFALASVSDQNGPPVSFQWETKTGEGYSAEAVREETGSMLMIDWSGRGVPVFAQQRTSASPGHYMLVLNMPEKDKAELSALTFRLTCKDTAVTFRPIGSDPTRLRTNAAVQCSYPMLQIAGDIQPSSAAHQMIINRVTMRPLGTTVR